MILEGHNRHEGLLRVMESLMTRNQKILPEEQIKKLANEWNQEHCSPPLDGKEFDKQWKCAIKYLQKVGPESNSETNAVELSDGNGEAAKSKDIKKT